MKSRQIAIFAGLATLAIAGLADAKLARVTTEAAKAHFHASGPAGMGIEGNTTDVSVADDGTTLKVIVALGNITTGISLRDDHTRNKYLEVGKFPNATLSVPRASLKFPADGGTTSGDVQGTMNIHGHDKAVTLHYAAAKKGASITIAGTTPLDITDFGINVPSYLGVTVKKDITVDISFVATDA